MSYLDKTYVTKEQYIIARNWWLKTKDKQKKELGFCQWLYPFSCLKGLDDPTNTPKKFFKEHTEDIDNFPEIGESCLWNTSSVFDLWLMKNCPFDFIQSRLKWQYGEDYWGFKYKDEFDFTEKPRILSMKDEKSSLYFFKELDTTEDDDNAVQKKDYYEIEYFDKMIVYGTTDIFKFIEDAFKVFGFQDKSEIIVTVQYYGLYVRFKGDGFYAKKKGDEVNDDGEKIDLPHIFEPKEFFNFPKIIHSYNLNDITQYEKFDRSHLRKYLYSIPEYVTNFIKVK